MDADDFLREARWAVDVYESAAMEHKDNVEGQRGYLKLAHATRYLKLRGGAVPGPRPGKRAAPADRVNGRMPNALPQGVGSLAQAHWLLWSNPLPPLASVYRTVWTDILKEQVTDLPVIGR